MPVRMDTHMTEGELQRIVVQLAKLRGWITYHTYDSRRSDQGFPDLVMVRERVIYVELKQEAKSKKVSPVQQKWIDALRAAGAEVYVWRPSDWDTIALTLARPKSSE